MKLLKIQTVCPVYLPEAGGSTGAYLHNKKYDLTLEGAWVLVRSREKHSSAIRVPLANVACIEALEDAAPGVVKKAS